MSSKAHRKIEARESVGVHCLCDGKYRVIEYTELDLYPQLLEAGPDGGPLHFAGNTAIHLFSVDFMERVARNFSEFPWHCSHKKVPYVNDAGEVVQPETRNAYKFETFVFDAMRYISHDPIVLEIDRLGDYTPIKQLTGANSVEAARGLMREYWAAWLSAAGCPPLDPAREVEINPQFALTQEEFVEKAAGRSWPADGDLAIGPAG